MESPALQQIVIAEMICWVRAICHAVEYVSKKFLDSLDSWKVILKKGRQMKTAITKNEAETDDDTRLLGYYFDKGCAVLTASLLVLASRTGGMNDHYATAVHKDGYKQAIWWRHWVVMLRRTIVRRLSTNKNQDTWFFRMVGWRLLKDPVLIL